MAPNDDENETKINNAILEEVFREPQQKLRRVLPLSVTERDVLDAIDDYHKTIPLDDAID